MEKRVFITYDLKQDTATPSHHLVRGAKEFQVSGKVVDWKVGKFESASGVDVYAVELTIIEDSGATRSQRIVEVPAHAQNVQLHEDSLPAEYSSALKNAA